MTNLYPGHNRKEVTRFSAPWVFKNSSSRTRLYAFSRHLRGSVFKGKSFGAREGSEIHILVNRNGN